MFFFWFLTSLMTLYPDDDDYDGNETTEYVVCHFKKCSVRLGFINMFAN